MLSISFWKNTYAFIVSLISFVILLESFACFKLAGYSEVDKALLKLCNIKYAIRSGFSLIISKGISEP